MDELGLSTTLSAAGLTHLGPADPTAPLVPPGVAGFISMCDAEDLVFFDGVDREDPQLAAKLNEMWQRATEAIGLAADAPLLLAVKLPPQAETRQQWGWVRVMRTERFDPASGTPGVLGHGAGHPSFVMLTDDGKAILQMTYGEVSGECNVARDPERIQVLRDHAARMLGWDRRRLDQHTRSAVERWLAAHPLP
ncbi:hypothetical protein ACH4E7_29450 [Kitasatospora sp. NPDC018058]|uniref:hypothetical protein n=1 Tax=Kitasatospora sp. NPDC018058 TaxID=3364025 RepID=UPI0037C1848C